MTKLKSLMFGTDQLTDESLRTLAKLPDLASLSFVGTRQITEDGMQEFVAKRAEKLISLDLPTLPVTDGFVKELAAKTPNLQYLKLGQCKAITDASIDPLSKFVGLRQLILTGSSITPQGVGLLIQRLPNCRVAITTRQQK